MRNRRWLVAGCAVLSLVVAGCGDDDSSSGSDLDGEPITVGVIGSFSGSFGTTIVNAEKVIRAWAADRNDGEGVNGHPIDLIVEDDASDPGKSVTAAQEMITQQADVIIDVTVLDNTWAEAVTDAGIPVVGGNLSSQLYNTNPLFYPSGQTNDSINYSTLAVAQQAGGTKFADLYCAEAPTCQESVEPLQQAAEDLGIPTVYVSSISASAPNYTAQCVAAQQAGADSLLVGHSASIVARVASDCAQQGYNPIILGQGTGYTSVLTDSEGSRDHYWAPFPSLPFFDTDNPLVQDFQQTVEAKYPDLFTDQQETMSQYAAQAWTAGLLIEAAVKAGDLAAGDSVSAENMVDALNSIHDETLGGWTGPLNFTEGETHSVPCWYTVRMQDGTPSLVSDDMTCE